MDALPILLLLGIIIFTAVQIYRGYQQGTSPDEGKMICPACGSQGWPVSKIKGNVGIEIVLWLCLIVPGLIYSVWRMTSRYDACASCQQAGMIPLNSPKGKQLAAQFATPSLTADRLKT